MLPVTLRVPGWLQFTVGPGPDSLTVFNATSVSWRMLDTVFTTHPVLAPPLPLPSLLYLDFEVAKAAPLALQVHNCADLKVGHQPSRGNTDALFCALICLQRNRK